MTEPKTPPTPDINFGSVPWLALPTMFLIIVVIGVGVALHVTDPKLSSTPTPTITPITRTDTPPIPNSGCVILEQTDDVILWRCSRHSRTQFSQ